jgi:hypothetical protein
MGGFPLHWSVLVGWHLWDLPQGKLHRAGVILGRFHALIFLKPIPVFFFILIFLLFLPTFFLYFLDSELTFLIVVVGLYCPFLSFAHDPIGVLRIPIHLLVIFLFRSSFRYSCGME